MRGFPSLTQYCCIAVYLRDRVFSGLCRITSIRRKEPNLIFAIQQVPLNFGMRFRQTSISENAMVINEITGLLFLLQIDANLRLFTKIDFSHKWMRFDCR